MESTKLLGQVLKTIISRQVPGFSNQPEQLREEICQLDNTLKSLIFAAEQEANKWSLDIHNQLTVCYR
jgi:hypothetical protein